MKKLYVRKSQINGSGIYTEENIKKHEFIAFIQGKVVTMVSNTKEEADAMGLLFGISKTKWIDPTGTIWQYFNHSCDPNTAIIGTKKVIALRNIEKDEELTFDYSLTDADLNWEMDCSCGSKNCRKKITSIQKLSQKVYKHTLPFIPKKFQKIRENYQKRVSIK